MQKLYEHNYECTKCGERTCRVNSSARWAHCCATCHSRGVSAPIMMSDGSPYPSTDDEYLALWGEDAQTTIRAIFPDAKPYPVSSNRIQIRATRSKNSPLILVLGEGDDTAAAWLYAHVTVSDIRALTLAFSAATTRPSPISLADQRAAKVIQNCA